MTLVIDIEKNLVTPIEIKTNEDLAQLKQMPNYKTNFLFLEKNQINEVMCCPYYKTKKCHCCQFLVYQVRPYAFDFLRAISPFFEIIAFSKIPRLILD